MNKAESIRIHMDWWGQCRTCKHYSGDRLGRGLQSAPCISEASPLFGEDVTHNGYCKKWDSFDVDAAIEVMEMG